MEKQMIRRLPITTAQNAPINKIESSTPQRATLKEQHFFFDKL